jgi:ribosomal-protein-serine acetyltransferase
MTIEVTPHLTLKLIDQNDASVIFAMVDQNREHLRTWLPFVDKMVDLGFAQNFVNGTLQRNAQGQEYAFIIYKDGEPVGRNGIYKIDAANKTAEIGYWLIKEAEGKGIVTETCKQLIDFCFTNLLLNRIEIKCAVDNLKSQALPIKLGFVEEGLLREAEWLGTQFTSLKLFSLLKSDVG